METLTTELFQRMVAIGARDDLSTSVVREALPELGTGDAWRLYPRIVHRNRSGLNPFELENLIRCMVLCEQEFEIPGGSVSEVKRVFRELTDRDHDRANQLAGWIVDNRGGNLYIPWGSIAWARSFEEYRQDEL